MVRILIIQEVHRPNFNSIVLVEHCQYTCPGGWEMRRVRSTLSDSDNIAISVPVQAELDLPTGTELGNNRINTK